MLAFLGCLSSGSWPVPDILFPHCALTVFNEYTGGLILICSRCHSLPPYNRGDFTGLNQQISHLFLFLIIFNATNSLVL